MEIDIESLERATLDAVAPTNVTPFAGWLVPFNRTTIGRAISAVPLSHEHVDPSSILEIESQYAQHGYRAMFRVADLAGLSNVHKALRERGYAPHQPTLTALASLGFQAAWRYYYWRKP